MAIQIQTTDGSDEIIEEISSAAFSNRFQDALPSEVQTGGPGHFEIRVTSAVFEGENRVSSSSSSTARSRT